MSELTFQDPKKKFCEELQAARERKGLELHRVSEKTKISLHYLERLESGQWDFLPHAYVRAFLRSYSAVVGLESARVLEQFDNIVDEPPVPVPGTDINTDEYDRPAAPRREKTEKKVVAPKKPKQKREVPKEPEKPKFSFAGEEREPLKKSNGSGASAKVFWIAGAAIIVLVAVVMLWPRGDNGERVSEIPFEEVVQGHDGSRSSGGIAAKPKAQRDAKRQRRVERETEPPKTLEQDPEPARGEEEVVVPPEAIPVDDVDQGNNVEDVVSSDEVSDQDQAVIPFVIEAVALSECYIRVNIDDESRPVSDIVLQEGMTRSYRAEKSLLFVLGNAAGMKLYHNGIDLGMLGDAGRVVTLRIGSEGIEEIINGVLQLDTTDGSATNGEIMPDEQTNTPFDPGQLQYR